MIRRSLGKPISKSIKRQRSRNRGQIVVEYALLLLIVVALATTLARLLVRRDPGDPGFIITVWNEMITTIGYDLPDRLDGE